MIRSWPSVHNKPDSSILFKHTQNAYFLRQGDSNNVYMRLVNKMILDCFKKLKFTALLIT